MKGISCTLTPIPKELIGEILARARITLRNLREVAALPEDRQMQVINFMLDTFIEGGTVSVRQVAAMVKEIRDRLEKLRDVWNSL